MKHSLGGSSQKLSLLCVEGDGKQESREALFTVLLSSPTTLHCEAPSAPTPKHMTDLFCTRSWGFWCVLSAGEIASVVLLPSRKLLQIEEELFGWVGTIFFLNAE